MSVDVYMWSMATDTFIFASHWGYNFLIEGFYRQDKKSSYLKKKISFWVSKNAECKSVWLVLAQVGGKGNSKDNNIYLRKTFK